MSRVKSLIMAALAMATAVPFVHAADTVTLTPSLVSATAADGVTSLGSVPSVVIGNTTYIYGSAQAGIYTIHYDANASLNAGEGFGSIATQFLLSSGVTLPASAIYSPDTAPVWFTSGSTTINNTFGPNNELVASVGAYTSADATRSAFAQSATAPVGNLRISWNGTTSNATVKLGDALDTTPNQIQFAVDNTTAGTLGGFQVGASLKDVQFITPLPGDATLDGTVNFSDFLVLQNNYNHTGTTWSQGDFNGDGVVNFSDFLLLQNSYNHSWTTGLTPAFGAGAVAAAPEPASAMLLTAGVAGLALRRKRLSK